MIKKEIKQSVRGAFTYHSDKGRKGTTSGYTLSEEQFQKIFKIMDLQQSSFEMLLARIIDDLYLENKKGFCGGRPHKLGWFKEQIKAKINEELNNESTMDKDR